MAENKNKKRTRSADDKKRFRSRTDVNKARRAKQRERKANDPKRAIRAEARKARAAAKRAANMASYKYKPGPNRVDPKPEIPLITIRLHEGKTFHVLTVEQVVDGPRDRTMLPKEHRDGAQGNLVSSGGVTFLTTAGKKWHMKFHEFAFSFNH